MADREYYNNKGNKEIKDNPELKGKEFYSGQFQDNKLPGEYFDCRVNGLECELNDDDKFAYDGSEGKSNQTSVNDMQDLSNALNTSTATTSSAANASIVEGAGTVVTGAATAVVGAAAAVVAFNAISENQPKMKVLDLHNGSSFVEYKVDVSNLDPDREYEIVIRNPKQSFRFDCHEGINENVVHNLKKGFSYDLCLVGSSELEPEIIYATKSFVTLSTPDVRSFSDIDIFYNDDLTTGLNLKTVIVDDYKCLDNSYVVITGDDKELFNSSKKYEGNASVDYQFLDNVHTLTFTPIDVNELYIAVYGMYKEESEPKLLEEETIIVNYQLKENVEFNYFNIEGNYYAIKDNFKFNVDNDNLYAKISLFDSSGNETIINKELEFMKRDETNNHADAGDFSLKQLFMQDTVKYSYSLGYLDNDGNYKIIKQTDRKSIDSNPMYSITPASGKDDYEWLPNGDIGDKIQNEKVDIKYSYDSDGKEYATITLKTDFDNHGNEDLIYKCELINYDHEYGTDKVVDTYIGSSKEVIFKNYLLSDDNPFELLFRYEVMAKYYDQNSTNNYEYKTLETFDYDVEFPVYVPYTELSFNQEDFNLDSKGRYWISLSYPVEDEQFAYKESDFVSCSVTMHFFNTVDEILETATFDDCKVEMMAPGNYRVFLEGRSMPYGYAGYNITYNIEYKENNYGNNLRRIATNDQLLMGDIQNKVVLAYKDEAFKDFENCECKYYLYAYGPEDMKLGVYEYEDEPILLDKDESGRFVYNPYIEPTTVHFAIFTPNGDGYEDISGAVLYETVCSTDYYTEYFNFNTYGTMNDHITVNRIGDDPDALISIVADTGLLHVDGTEDSNKYEFVATLKRKTGEESYEEIDSKSFSFDTSNFDEVIDSTIVTFDNLSGDSIYIIEYRMIVNWYDNDGYNIGITKCEIYTSYELNQA